MTTDPQTRPPAPPPASGVLRFALTAGAWFIGLFGLMRLGWVERQLLVPFAQLQERVADQLTGAPTDAVYVDASCSGGDAMALCLGAVLAFPAPWSARLRGAGIGLLVITSFNIVRIGNLSLLGDNLPLLDLLHVYIWPAILIVVAVAYVYAWMRRQMGPAVQRCRLGSRRRLARPGPAVSAAHRRGHRRLLRGGCVGVRERPTAHPGRLGGHDQRRRPGGLWGVSHGLREHRHDDARRVHCDPGVYRHPPDSRLSGRGARGAPRAVAARGRAGRGPGDLFPLGRRPAPGARAPDDAGRLAHRGHPCLLPGAGRGPPCGRAGGAVRPIGRPPASLRDGLWGRSVWGSSRRWSWGPSGAAFCTRTVDGGQVLVQHGGHRVVDDPQGALAILPALQLGLCAACWAAIGWRGPWRRLVLGIVGLAGLQLTVLLVLGELSHHHGICPPREPDPSLGRRRAAGGGLGAAVAAPHCLTICTRARAPTSAAWLASHARSGAGTPRTRRTRH